jgi:hypothetical protein
MQAGYLTHLAAAEHIAELRREAERHRTARAGRRSVGAYGEPTGSRGQSSRLRFAASTALITAALCGALATAAFGNPVNATGVRTYERVCDNGMAYTTYKVGHGAAFIAGSDEKFVNLGGGNAAAAQDDLVACDFVQVDGPTKGATSGALTSKIVP